MDTYTYSVSSDTLNGEIDANSLTASIRESAITTALQHVIVNGDILDIVFKDSVASDQTSLIDSLVATHTGEASDDACSFKIVPSCPRGSGVRFRTPCMTDMTSSFDVTVASGKKLMMLISKVTFDDRLQGDPHIVFEIRRKINFGLPGDPQYYIVDQNFYTTLADVVVDADRCLVNGHVFRIDFDWPDLTNPNREATVLIGTNYEDQIRVYMTDDDQHVGAGYDSSNLYHMVGPVKVYHPYNVTTSPPTWPEDDVPAVKLAHVCLHCVAFDEDEI